MSQQLQYNYAQIDTATGRCIDVFTASDYIPFPDEYIIIPVFTYDYHDKYYNSADGLWYWDSEFTQIWEECPSHAE